MTPSVMLVEEAVWPPWMVSSGPLARSSSRVLSWSVTPPRIPVGSASVSGLSASVSWAMPLLIWSVTSAGNWLRIVWVSVSSSVAVSVVPAALGWVVVVASAAPNRPSSSAAAGSRLPDSTLALPSPGETALADSPRGSPRPAAVAQATPVQSSVEEEAMRVWVDPSTRPCPPPVSAMPRVPARPA